MGKILTYNGEICKLKLKRHQQKSKQQYKMRYSPSNLNSQESKLLARGHSRTINT